MQPWLDVPQLGSAVVVTTEQRAATGGGLVLRDCRRAVASPRGVFAGAAFRPGRRRPGPRQSRRARRAERCRRRHDQRFAGRQRVGSAGAPQVRLAAPGSRHGRGARNRAGSRAAGSRPALVWQHRRRARHRFGISIPLAADVESVFDARFVLNGHLGKNLAIDMGRSAVLRAGQVRVIVTSRSGPHFAPELFQAAGFDPFAACGRRRQESRRISRRLCRQGRGDLLRSSPGLRALPTSGSTTTNRFTAPSGLGMRFQIGSPRQGCSRADRNVGQAFSSAIN